jgi:hypothetical protein
MLIIKLYNKDNSYAEICAKKQMQCKLAEINIFILAPGLSAEWIRKQG